MNTSRTALQSVAAQDVSITDDALVVDLTDGRTIAVPIAWFPALAEGTSTERANYRLIGGGEGIHWPDLDEDVSVASMVAGHGSGERPESLRRWLRRRKSAR